MKGVILIKNINLSKKQNNSKFEEKKPKKPKKVRVSFFFKLLGIIILGFFIYFAIKSTNDNASYSVFERLDSLKQEEQPYLVVIRDDFSQVTKDNKKVINSIVKDGKESMMVFDIDYDPKSITKDSKYFIDKYDIESLPVVILCDGNGELIKTYYLPFNDKQIIKDVKRAAESSVT